MLCLHVFAIFSHGSADTKKSSLCKVTVGFESWRRSIFCDFLRNAVALFGAWSFLSCWECWAGRAGNSCLATRIFHKSFPDKLSFRRWCQSTEVLLAMLSWRQNIFLSFQSCFSTTELPDPAALQRFFSEALDSIKLVHVHWVSWLSCLHVCDVGLNIEHLEPSAHRFQGCSSGSRIWVDVLAIWTEI